MSQVAVAGDDAQQHVFPKSVVACAPSARPSFPGFTVILYDK